MAKPVQSSPSGRRKPSTIWVLSRSGVVEAGSDRGPLPHAYSLSIDAGEIARIVVNQHEIDLFVDVTGPDRLPVRYDQHERGPEFITLFGCRAGAYLMEIGCVDGRSSTADYTISSQVANGKAPDDDLRIVAEAAATEGKRLAALRDAQSSREALLRYSQALEMWKELGEKHGVASALLSMAELYYFQSQYDRAVDYFENAMAAYLCNEDRRGVAEAQNGLGVTFRQLGRIEEAVLTFNHTLHTWRFLNNAAGEAATLSNLGALSYEVGEWQQAINYFSTAREIAHSLNDAAGEGYACHNLAVVHNALGQHRRALTYLNLALRMFRRARNTRAAARVLLLLGQIHLLLDNLKLAEKFGMLALARVVALGDGRSKADTLRHLGQLAEKTGDLTEALARHSDALETYRAIGNQQGESAALHGLGTTYSQAGRDANALRLLAQARRVRKKLGTSDGEAETLFAIARIASRRGRLSASRRHIEAAIRIAEELRNRVAGADLRTSYFSYKHDYYGFSIELLMRLHNDHPEAGFQIRAFEVSERARARGLLDLLNKIEQRPGEEPSSGLSEQQDRLQRRIQLWSFRRARAMGMGDPNETERATQQLAPLLEAYEDLNSRLASPNSWASDVESQLFCLKQVQEEVLDEQTMLLQYAFGESRCYLWVVTAESIRTFDLGPDGPIDEASRRLYSLMTTAVNRSRKPETIAQCNQAAAALSRLLLPVEAFMPGRKQLIFASDGVMHYIPFAALLHPGLAEPLISHFEIVSVPSVSVLASLRRARVPPDETQKTAAIIADPVFDGDDPRVLESGSAGLASCPGGGVGGLSRLPFSRMEAEHIRQLVPESQATIAVDFAANATVISTASLGNSRIIHFASHALVDDQNPGLSSLVLSLVKSDGTSQDGLVGLNRIFQLRLNADLVVLSACKTGLGKEVRGEGIVGLTRAFMYAGAARVLVTLWKVDDEATSELMHQFYLAMLGPRKLSAGAALRVAQCWMLSQQRWKHPYYWAGFAIQGEWR